MYDLSKFTYKVSRDQHIQTVCPFCGNWYHDNEVRAVVDYCPGCNGKQVDAKKADDYVTERYDALVKLWDKETVTPEDIQPFFELQNILRGRGYWSSELRIVQRKLCEKFNIQLPE